MAKHIRKCRTKAVLAMLVFFLFVISFFILGYLFDIIFAGTNLNSESLKVYRSSMYHGTIPVEMINHGQPGESKLSQKAQDFITRTEKVRIRFVGKRERVLIGNRDLDEIGLFEANDGATTVWNFFPPTFTCPHLIERVGTPGDGGKWMCGLELFEKEHLKDDCIVYSFGVAGDSSFEQEILERTNCKIYAFDPTVTKLSFGNVPPTLREDAEQRARFFKIGLGASHKRGLLTLGEIMAEHGHSWIDFLKVDIEGAEFESFRQIASEFNETFPFGHLNIEIHLKISRALLPSWVDGVRQWLGMQHGNYNNDKGHLKEFYEFWNILEHKGLRAFSWEDNHNPCIFGRNPNLMEYAFINVKDDRNKLLQL